MVFYIEGVRRGGRGGGKICMKKGVIFRCQFSRVGASELILPIQFDV